MVVRCATVVMKQHMRIMPGNPSTRVNRRVLSGGALSYESEGVAA